MSQLTLDPALLQGRIRSPVVIALGSPGEVVGLLAQLGTADVTCYQMDLYQAGRLEEALGSAASRQRS